LLTLSNRIIPAALAPLFRLTNKIVIVTPRSYQRANHGRAKPDSAGSANLAMRIMIDGFNLALPRGTGVSTYGYNLALAARAEGYSVEALYGLRAPFNRKLRDIMFYESMGNEHATKAPKPWQPSFYREFSMLARPKTAREISTNGSVISQQFSHRMPPFDRIFTAPDIFDQAVRHFRRFGFFLPVRVPNPPDIMHWTYPLPVKMIGAKNVYTLHDLVPLKLPYASLDNKRAYFKLIRACAKWADHICTVSDASKTDIEQLFPDALGKVTNTFQAVRLPTAALATDEADVEASVRNIFNLPYKNYFLFFGAVEPKKNVGRLIEAYLSLSTNAPLVIVGTRAWGSEIELRLLQRDEIQPLKATFRNIRRIDYLPRNLLLRLVRGAKAVAFPSLYEGFGLPALEAMMLGTPVITANTSSLPEVVGDAAMQVDPYNPVEIAAALRQLDIDAELRTKLSIKGRMQAEKFSMANYQSSLAAMYRRIVSQ
jgi:glycosyltransferase involved in cell wall biosynthesis